MQEWANAVVLGQLGKKQPFLHKRYHQLMAASVRLPLQVFCHTWLASQVFQTMQKSRKSKGPQWAIRAGVSMVSSSMPGSTHSVNISNFW